MEIGSLDSFHQVLPLDAIRRPLKPILQTEEQKLCKGFEWVPWPVNQLVGAAAAAILDECEAAASVWNVDRVLMKQTFRQVSMYEVKFVQCVMGTAYCVYYMCRTHDKFSVVFMLLSDGLNNLLDDATVCRHHVSIILSFLPLASTSLLHLCCVY